AACRLPPPCGNGFARTAKESCRRIRWIQGWAENRAGLDLTFEITASCLRFKAGYHSPDIVPVELSVRDFGPAGPSPQEHPEFPRACSLLAGMRCGRRECVRGSSDAH